MKYALLAYDSEGSLAALSPEDKRALHEGHRAQPDDYDTAAGGSVSVIAHYRFRPGRHTTTVKRAGNDVVKVERPTAEASEALRALYLVESDDPDAVLELASRLPAVRLGGSVEVWPLIEPIPHERQQHGPRG